MDRFHSARLDALRRRARFSLTTLLVLVAIAAICCARVGNRIRAVRSAIDAVVNARGRVYVMSPDDWWHRLGVGEWTDRIYAVSFCVPPESAGELSRDSYDDHNWPVEDGWLADIIVFFTFTGGQGVSLVPGDAGDDVLARLAEVGPDILALDLRSPRVTDIGAVHLAQFTNLRIVMLNGSSVTDRGALALSHKKYVQAIELDDTDVTDACLGSLLESPRLYRLSVEGTKVTQEGIRRIVARLEDRPTSEKSARSAHAGQVTVSGR